MKPFLCYSFSENEKTCQSFLPVFVMPTLSIFLVELSFCLLKITDFHFCLADWNMSYLSGQRYLLNMLIELPAVIAKQIIKFSLSFKTKKS